MPRPPQYDRETVIIRATRVFWEKGYGKTSVPDLVAATGLQPGSLYSAFGNKKGLFLEVVDQYNRDFLARVRQLRDADGLALDKLRRLLQQIVEDTVDGSADRGCLTVNALLELSRHDEEIEERLCAHNARLRKAFAWLIKDAQLEGDIAPQGDPNELAAFVMNNIWGIRVMCRSRPDRASLEAIVTSVIGALEAPRD